jgi:hypothetical protein
MKALFFVAVLSSACSAAPTRLPTSRLVLPGSDGKQHDVSAEIAQHPFSVFVFGAEECGCLDAHAARLRELGVEYGTRNVSFRLVDSEVGASAERSMALARSGNYGFPVLTDSGAKLADALHAEFATHSVVVDPSGRICYSGAIDSDSARLHADAKLYLREALDDLLRGRAPREPSTEALGCALRKH